MTVINNEWQIKTFRKLVELAGDDRDLAWEAIRKNADESGFAELTKVCDYIKKRVLKSRTGVSG
jgi:hypothetical protein